MVFVLQAPRSNYRRNRLPRKYVKAYRAQIRDRTKWPVKEWGTAHLKRGAAWVREQFGENQDTATAGQKEARQLSGWKGKGRYTFGGGFNANADLNATGSILGQKYDLKAHGAGNFFGSNMSGSGMYNSELHGDSNQLIDKMGSSVAMQIVDSENTLVIQNREFITDIAPPATSGNFYTALSSAINPGLTNLFPWLSQIALYYEEYEFEQLIFEFKSMVTEGNQNAQGNIIMATQYNALNPLFSSKQQMENYDYANSSKVTQNAFHGVECNPQLNAAAALYVRSGNVPTGQDAKTYDLGIFQFAVSNGYQTSSINLGEVWVSYRIKLRKSKLILPGYDLSPVVFAASYTATSSSFSNLFSGSLTRVLSNNTVADMGANNANTLSLPSFITGGTYNMRILLPASTVITTSTPTSFYNCAAASPGPWTTASGATTGGINIGLCFLINVTGPNPTVTIPAPTGTHVAGTVYIYISQVSGSLA